MATKIVLLSGPVAAGKTSVAGRLVKQFGFRVVKSREMIAERLGTEPERRALQNAGEKLDRKTGGKWIAEHLARLVQTLAPNAMILVDAVRIQKQVDEVRGAFGASVVHVHLTAPDVELESRYASRKSSVRELPSYRKVRENKTERGVSALAEKADIVIDTHRSTPQDVVVRVAAHLGLYGSLGDRLVDVLVGGQYGSEGKGQISAYLAPEYSLLVRVGGPNAGHKVYERPNPYAFHLLPSGTRCSDAQLALGPGAVLSLKQLFKEVSECQVAEDRLSIDPRAMIIEAKDIAREQKTLVGSIGSTGQGVGQATARKVLRTSASPSVRLARDVPELRAYIRETAEVLERTFAAGRRVFLEGTQGTGLSLHHGSYPHVTSRDTTASGCLAEAGIAPGRVRRVVMVCRTYPIRVQNPAGGTSGTMSREISLQEVATRSGIAHDELERTETTTTTRRKRRVAEFDWELLRRASLLNSPTDIAITFADYLTIKNQKARRFEQLSPATIRFIDEVERVTGAAVSLVATRFHFRSVIDRRAW